MCRSSCLHSTHLWKQKGLEILKQTFEAILHTTCSLKRHSANMIASIAFSRAHRRICPFSFFPQNYGANTTDTWVLHPCCVLGSSSRHQACFSHRSYRHTCKVCEQLKKSINLSVSLFCLTHYNGGIQRPEIWQVKQTPHRLGSALAGSVISNFWCFHWDLQAQQPAEKYSVEKAEGQPPLRITLFSF